MDEFIDDFTATLAAETNLPANAIFLKAHSIPFQKLNSTVQDDVGFIPVLKVMVQVGYLSQFNAQWEKTADGTWMKSARGFQTAIWKSVKNLKEWRIATKRPITLPGVFVHGLQPGWTVHELSTIWQEKQITSGR